ncbi:MAG: hypothetical protein PF569_09485 [Candidatus Woesearchaeota archaeon]|jgi:hypothetical protein|nr:hypothetical protein [Candidatus Woesearchaeota archaeon]
MIGDFINNIYKPKMVNLTYLNEKKEKLDSLISEKGVKPHYLHHEKLTEEYRDLNKGIRNYNSNLYLSLLGVNSLVSVSSGIFSAKFYLNQAMQNFFINQSEYLPKQSSSIVSESEGLYSVLAGSLVSGATFLAGLGACYLIGSFFASKNKKKVISSLDDKILDIVNVSISKEIKN